MCRTESAAAQMQRPIFYFALENPSHGDCPAGEVADLVVVEIGISGYGESSGLCTDAADGFRALVEQIENLGTDLEVESSVVTETSVL